MGDLIRQPNVKDGQVQPTLRCRNETSAGCQASVRLAGEQSHLRMLAKQNVPVEPTFSRREHALIVPAFRHGRGKRTQIRSSLVPPTGNAVEINSRICSRRLAVTVECW